MTAQFHIDDDLKLFALLKQGDQGSFEKIYKRYWLELYNAAYKRLPEKEKCQDIIQNVFTDLWLRRESLEINNPTAYLHTAVRFQVLKAISRTPKSDFVNEFFERELISPLQSDDVVLEKETKRLIELYLNTLPRKRRNIFIMHFYDGLSTAKIAIELNVSQKTVQNQLATASHGLRFRLTHLFLMLVIALSLIMNG